MRPTPRVPGPLAMWLSFSATAVLVGCGGSGGSDPVPPPAPQPKACADLNGMAIAAADIGLPTTGALVTAATTVAAAGSGATATPEFCRVSAAISPVDPAAPKILLQVALPTTWNNKALMFGGGGYNGLIPAVTGNVPAGPTAQATPLGRGYATFASDSGHQAGALGSQDGSFGVNDEAVRNFSGEALKKTRDTAVAIIKARYAAGAPSKAYFAGGSTGGREALAVAQKWPQDWDGVISLYPAGAAASLDLQFGRITRALAQPGAYANPAKRKQLYDAAMQACDALDGVADGLISDIRSCNAVFNPATASVNGAPLRCAGGADTGDSCLSDAQIAAFNVINTPITFGYPLASG